MAAKQASFEITLADRNVVLELLQELPAAGVADDDEVLAFIERHRLCWPRSH